MEALPGLFPLAKIGGIIAIVLAGLGWLWNTKRVSKAHGVAEERARQDAANNELLHDKRTTDEDVRRLREDEARRELNRWGNP